MSEGPAAIPPEGLSRSTMQDGCRRMMLWMKAMASMAPAGDAETARRASFLAKAAMVYAGTSPDDRNRSASLKNWARCLAANASAVMRL